MGAGAVDQVVGGIALVVLGVAHILYRQRIAAFYERWAADHGHPNESYRFNVMATGVFLIVIGGLVALSAL
jgi:hypothetical protein